jgi:hypothetical protein
MTYRKYYRHARPSPRVIEVKYAGKCVCCGAPIKAGETATYYPPGTIANVHEGKIAHVGGLDGTSARCSNEIKQRATNDYAGDGLDARYEDQCRDACGL